MAMYWVLTTCQMEPKCFTGPGHVLISTFDFNRFMGVLTTGK